MAEPLTYDDSELQKLFEEMSPKERKKLFRGTSGRTATMVRRTAVSNLRKTLNSNKALEKGIRKVVSKKSIGFRVTIGSKKMKGRNKGKRNGVRRYGKEKMTWTGFEQYTTSRGKDKPILIWAEPGTKWRTVKAKNGGQRFMTAGGWKTTKAHGGRYRGRMKRGDFMEKTLLQTKGKVTIIFQTEIEKGMQKIAKKHGCT